MNYLIKVTNASDGIYYQSNLSGYPVAAIHIPPHTHDFTYSADGATITATCGTEGCTLANSQATLTIEKPTLTTYGETGKSAAATLTGLEAFNAATSLNVAATDIKYVGRDGTTYAESATAPTNAGKYTAKITLSGVKTSEGEGKSVTASVDYEIAKAATTVTTAPTAGEITYGQTLADSTLTGGAAVMEGSTTGLAGTFAWKNSTVAPAVSDSENTEYDVVFTPTDMNYSTAECKVKLTVNTAENPITYPEKQAVTKTFSTASQTATLEAAKDGIGELSYGITSQKRGEETVNYFTLDGTTLTLAQNTPVGTYTVVVWTRAAGNGNVYGRIKESEVTVTIDKATPTVTAPTAKTLTYTGSAQELVNAGSTNDGKLYYAVTTENTAPTDENLYTTSIPAKTEAGTYYVWYKVKGDANHADSTASAPVTVTISPVNKDALNAAISAAEAYYDEIKGNADYAAIAETLKSAIDAAKEVANNDNATAEQVGEAVNSVTNAKKTAEDAVKAAEKKATDEAAAKAVTDAINALPESAGVNDKAKVEAARKAYDALTEDQKKLIPEDALAKLTAAERQVREAEEAAKTINIANCKITVKNQTYTGKALKPAVTVKYGKATLKKGTDYTVSYKNNTKIGRATVTVKGKGRYTGSRKLTFKISPKGTRFTTAKGGKQQIVLKWKNPKNVIGYVIQCSQKKNFSSKRTAIIRKAGTLSRTIRRVKANKTYYVRIRTYTKVNKKIYRSAWSEVVAVRTKAGGASNVPDGQAVEGTAEGEDMTLILDGELDEGLLSEDIVVLSEALPEEDIPLTLAD